MAKKTDVQTSKIELLEGKSTVEADGYLCTPLSEQNGVIALKCPACGCRNGIKVEKAEKGVRCRCGAALAVKK